MSQLIYGNEGSGRVVEIGEGDSKVSSGDLVILGWIKGSGLECFLVSGRSVD